MKIIDCFIFYNELDLLNYRMNILNDVVDFFVIVESTRTHVGKEKQLFFSENKHLFEKFNDKIILVVVDDFPYKHPININHNEQWKNENFQRNAISRGLQRIDLQNEDIIIVSDLDELPDPTTLNKIKNGELHINANSLEMDLYYYNLYTKMSEKWSCSKMISYKCYKDMNTGCNNIRHLKLPVISKGGWHLSYFGDSSFIVNKLMNFTHQEFNNNKYTDIKFIEEEIKNSNNFLFNKHIGRTELKDNAYLPPMYDLHLTNFF